jgi:hypothetical protein
MRKYDLWSSLVLFLLGTAIGYGSLKLGLGTWAAPGPGFLPFGAGLGLSLLSIGIFVLAVLNKETVPATPEKFFPQPDSQKIVSLVFLALIIYNFLWMGLGFSLTTFLFLAFLFRLVGKRNWWVTILGSALTSILAYALFQVFLKSQLPTGFIGF